MTRLIRADLLKLRRRRGMVALIAGFALGAVLIYYGAGLIMGERMGGAGHFGDATGVLALIASVIGVIAGATAGGADVESGVYRDLVATGRSRTALFFSRVPAAWILVLGALAAALAVAALLAWTLPGDSGPGASAAWHGGVQVLATGALTAAVCVGLAALTGSRGPVMGVALAFQLGVAPLLAELDVLGDARLAIPSVALARLDTADGLVAHLALPGAIAILLAWAAAGLGAGLWRARTQEI
jgi:ABC-type transport system involved in multi-copper enzyme maturation permease subunit